MHFWIDKRSQCAYSGRHRVPSSLSSGAGLGRARGCCARKAMAAPVHRDCPPRRPRAHRPHPSGPVAGGRGRGTAAAGAPTIASLAAARAVTPDTLLRTAALSLHHSPVMAPHLKFGMLVSFALATVFLAGAKYYFDRQVVRESGGGEAGVVCAAVACVCGVGCALARCRPAPRPAAPPDRVSSTAHRDPPISHSDPSEDISLATLLVPERPVITPSASALVNMAAAGSEAPPPYNIAVLMPVREPSPPPPAYSAIS